MVRIFKVATMEYRISITFISNNIHVIIIDLILVLLNVCVYEFKNAELWYVMTSAIYSVLQYYQHA